MNYYTIAEHIIDNFLLCYFGIQDYSRAKDIFVYCGTLARSFDWGDTPEGFRFWSTLDHKQNYIFERPIIYKNFLLNYYFHRNIIDLSIYNEKTN